jgi:hypothetical protein
VPAPARSRPPSSTLPARSADAPPAHRRGPRPRPAVPAPVLGRSVGLASPTAPSA